ncbi:class I SAM-dependent methyltransferase [Spirosoma sp. KCTC 42546]|uniref:class I SAM-dependent methyltransferase n=1 Tax=Spirosoma sp. KCTC 42546 TaxID=2520506 RepID=UPI001158FD62|nr:class I SAM-dependent methyltransferase [Spirosoma sp. KCTC 42546]QDK81069.1 class I SAM-dependent methyltransferase [Spirosoma sp. KCTC 42546]
MKENNTNTKNAKIAFDTQSIIFDNLYADNSIIDYKRARTRSHLEKYLIKESKLLELNAGTGQDAVYFALQGHRVHATDISDGMLSQLAKKIVEKNLSKSISYEKLSFDKLSSLQNRGPYDAIFSNFGGLNCTDRLDNVLDSFAPLLKPEGTATLVIMPPFCFWEFMMLIKGNFRLAFRRLFAKKGASAHIEGVYFSCWYYWPSFIINRLNTKFKMVELVGLCTIVPPSYLEKFPQKYSTLYNLLINLENKLKNRSPFKYIGDYYIITLKKNAQNYHLPNSAK